MKSCEGRCTTVEWGSRGIVGRVAAFGVVGFLDGSRAAYDLRNCVRKEDERAPSTSMRTSAITTTEKPDEEGDEREKDDCSGYGAANDCALIEARRARSRRLIVPVVIVIARAMPERGVHEGDDRHIKGRECSGGAKTMVMRMKS